MRSIDPKTQAAVTKFLSEAGLRYETVGAWLYGSRANGSHRADSDADVALVLNGARGRTLSAKLALADIAFEVLLETGILVSPLPVWIDEWEHPETFSNPALLRHVKEHGVSF